MFWENIPRLHSTSGGLSDTDANELQVSPEGLPSGPAAVMMVTPVAYVPSAFRKSLGSIGELPLASSLAGSGSVGCFGVSVIRRLKASNFRRADQAQHGRNWCRPHRS